MGKEKKAITPDKVSGESGRLASAKLLRLKRRRLAVECGKLCPEYEKAMAEEGMGEDAKWEY